VETAESRLTEREVYERDIEWLDACDVLVADASGSSYGVGFEVGYVLGRSNESGQRVVLLYRADRQPLISRLICGNSHERCTTIPYANASELADRIPTHLKPRTENPEPRTQNREPRTQNLEPRT
jgi:hypothetical protein